jgi:hypothetical protein
MPANLLILIIMPPDLYAADVAAWKYAVSTAFAHWLNEVRTSWFCGAAKQPEPEHPERILTP